MSLEAEQSILGGLMLLEFKGKQAEKAINLLKPSYFQHPLNKSIYQASLSLMDQGESADVITIDSRLSNNPVYQDMDGLSYLIDLAKNTPSASNIMSYIGIVRESAVKKFAVTKLNEALALITDPDGGDIYQKLGLAESLIGEINKKGITEDKGLRHVKEFGKEWFEDLEKYHEGDKDSFGFTTGILGLDAMLRPKLIPKGSLVVVGARPKMGKSALMTLLANHSAIDLQLNTPIFSMEMSGKQIFERSITTDGKANPIDFYNQQSGPVYDRLHDSAGRILSSKMFIDDMPAMTIDHIKREARNIAKDGPVGCIAVDYLTLMEAKKAERNDLAYGEITKSLKNLAKELNCYVVLLTQLNRKLEDRADKRPMPSDSRDTGQIEQDCDMWIGIYRHGVYDEDCKHPGLTEGIVRLNRHGQTGTFFMDLQAGYFVPVNEAEGLHMKSENEPAQQSNGGRKGFQL